MPEEDQEDDSKDADPNEHQNLDCENELQVKEINPNNLRQIWEIFLNKENQVSVKPNESTKFAFHLEVIQCAKKTLTRQEEQNCDGNCPK